MKNKLVLSPEEYSELQRLKSIVNNKNNLPGERRLAMAKFNNLYNYLSNKNNTSSHDMKIPSGH